jgi:hypothetical protein
LQQPKPNQNHNTSIKSYDSERLLLASVWQSYLQIVDLVSDVFHYDVDLIDLVLSDLGENGFHGLHDLVVLLLVIGPAPLAPILGPLMATAAVMLLPGSDSRRQGRGGAAVQALDEAVLFLQLSSL